MKNSIKAFCALKCVETIKWMTMFLLSWLLVFVVNYGIVHDLSKAIEYSVIEIVSLFSLCLTGIGLFVCIKNAKREFLVRKQDLMQKKCNKLCKRNNKKNLRKFFIHFFFEHEEH
jgi:hypothetical protein